jgi:ACT domain-containing protein
MNEITRSSRVTTALQVIQRMNEGLSVKEACSEVGMPRSTYYYVIASDTEAIALFQDMVTANHRERLWMILVNQANILQRLIDDGLAETTKPKDRLAIYKALGDMRDKLAQELQVNRHEDIVAAEFLRGPTLHKGVSRFEAGSTPDEN